jgi:hypothetical protein
MMRLGLVGLLAVLAAVVSLSSPARAQLHHYYASPTGTAFSSCLAANPCNLFEAITNAVPTGGEVNCIDGGFAGIGNISVSNSITIDCPGGYLVPSLPSSNIAIAGNSSQVVILRNLTFDGDIQLGSPFIKVTGGATLIIENCRFQNLTNGNAIAIQFTPNGPAAQLIIRDSVFANNGILPGTGGGIQVAPTGSGSASVRLERVSFDFNVTSMVLSGPVNATMIGSVVQASRNTGIIVGSGATLDIDDSKLVYNVGSAVSVSSGGTLTLLNTDIRHNQIGVSNSGGQALSFKNNRILGNGSTAALGTITGGQ